MKYVIFFGCPKSSRFMVLSFTQTKEAVNKSCGYYKLFGDHTTV